MSKYEHMSVFKEPQCLIWTKDKGCLCANEGVLAEISSIKETLIVVAMVGLYRTGKSFLLNKFINTKSGFPVGKTTQSKTKGIWVFCSLHPTQENTVLILLDTEGLGDVKKGDVNHDNRILALTVAMCNIFCYNIQKVLDEDAIDKIAFLSSNIDKRCSSPDLVICIRDFTLTMEMTEDEYLMRCLKQREGDNKTMQRYNLSRTRIKNGFRQLKCFTFDFPAERAALKSQIEDNDFSLDFNEDVCKLKAYVYGRSPNSYESGIDGFMLTSVIRCHVESVNSGIVPEMHDALQNAYKQANAKHVTNCCEKLKHIIKDIAVPVLNSKKYDELCSSKVEPLLSDLRQQLRYDDTKIYERHARERMARIIDEMKQCNNGHVKQYCNTKLKYLYSTNVGSEQGYFKIGGHGKYKSLLNAFKTKYRTQCTEVDHNTKENALQKFLDEKSEVEFKIKTEDDRLTREEDERQKEQIRREHERQKQEALRLYEERKREENMRREREQREQEEIYRRQEQIRQEQIRTLEEETRRMREIQESEMRRLENEREKDCKLKEAEIRRIQEENRVRQEQWERRIMENEERKEQEELRRRKEENERQDNMAREVFCPICQRFIY